jgi:hypothetical protein
MALSKSAQAAMWLSQDATRTQADAAKLFGVARSTIARAVSVRVEADACPCCGQTMREGAKRGPKPKTAN